MHRNLLLSLSSYSNPIELDNLVLTIFNAVRYMQESSPPNRAQKDKFKITKTIETKIQK